MALPDDPAWTYLTTDPRPAGRRETIQRLRNRYAPFADRNFDQELRTQFAPRFWEMWLACALLDRGISLVPRSERASAGPDLCVKDRVRTMWIEAVAPTAGCGADAVPSDDDGAWVPDEKIVLRYRAAVEEKVRQHRAHVAAGRVAPDDPYIIAVNGHRIPNGVDIWADEVPYAIQAVLPLGNSSVTIDRESGEVVGQGFETRWHIEKASGTRISTAVFLDPEYASVSGLIFSGVDPVDSPLEYRSRLSFLHNPRTHPSVALERGWLSDCVEYWVEGNALRYRNCPGA